MNKQVQMVSLWCGPVALGVFIIGFWVVAGFVPPPSPDNSAQETAEAFRNGQTRIQVGMLLTQIAAALTGPWVAVISVQMQRVEGRRAPLAYLQLGMGMLSILLFIFPAMAWEAAAFRADRDPELVHLMNDFAWLPFVGVFAIGSLQLLAVAGCAFMDDRQLVFPRWIGWLNLFMAMGFGPVALIQFFKTGPFAWNGLISFWLPFSLFWLWFVVMFAVLHRAIRSDGRDADLVPVGNSSSTASLQSSPGRSPHAS